MFNHMKQWEYKMVKLDSSGLLGGSRTAPSEEFLNELGNDRWELVTIIPVKNDKMHRYVNDAVLNTLALKRPVE